MARYLKNIKVRAIILIVIICSISLAVKSSLRFLWEQKPIEVPYLSLEVKGNIPPWLKGVFINNVPAILQGEEDRMAHWFDGLAMLQAFYIHNGQVNYKSSFLKSEGYKRYQSTNKFDFNGFAQKSKTEHFSFIEFIFGAKKHLLNNANVNVTSINKRLVALTELPLPVEFDVELNTLGVLDYKDKLPKKYSVESAHLLKDPDTQNIWNYLIKIGILRSSYQIYTIPNGSIERKLVASIPVSAISYIHSFSMTENYFILVDYPLRSKKPRDLGKGFIEAFSWQKNEPSYVYLINKKTGKHKKFKTSSFFSFHHVNAFEENGQIFIDLITYPSDQIITEVNDYPFLSNIPNKLVRLTIDLADSNVKLDELTQETIEFPRINEAFIGKKYKYFYAVKFMLGGNGLIKYDHTKEKKLYWFEPGCYANEPIFVANPTSKSEDDGVILSIINDLHTNQSFLMILDGLTFKEIARIKTPHLLPFALHGQFFPY